MLKRLLQVAAILAVVALAVLLYAWRTARQDPVVRQATVEMARWPAGAAPLRVALLSDIHIGNRTTDTDRLERIVAQVNALRPDLVLLAGDYIAGHDRGSSARLAPMLAPLKRLSAPLGAVAVLGNHDWWTGAPDVVAALEAAGVTMADNRVVRRGPVAIAGIGDTFTNHDRIVPVLAALRSWRGPSFALTHSPEVSDMLPPGIGLVLAGHTHCGQAVVLGRALGSEPYPRRFRCGIVRDPGRTTVVTGGVGTSVVPLRIGVPPDLWLLTLRGPARP